MNQHKWNKEIKAWADGAEIEYFSLGSGWQVTNKPEWLEESEYRIKPQPKVKKWLWATADGKDSTFGFHASGEDADKYEGNIDEKAYSIKLLWSETEFEVDDETL